MKKKRIRRTFSEWFCDTCSAIWDFIFTVVVGVAVLLLVTFFCLYLAQYINTLQEALWQIY